MKSFNAMLSDIIKNIWNGQEVDGSIDVEVKNDVNVIISNNNVNANVTNEALEVNIKDQESITGKAVRIIGYEEEYTAYGYSWASNVVINIPANTTISYTIDLSAVPANREVYRLGAHINSKGAEIRFRLFEGTNYTGGTEIVFYNPNRKPEEQKPKSFIVRTGATGTVKGIQLSEHVAFGDTSPGQTRTTGSIDISAPLTFNNTQKYLIEYSNVSNTAAVVEIDVLYIEADF